MFLIPTKNDDKIFLEDLNYKNQYKKFYHYQHLLDFLNQYDTNIDVLSILSDTSNGKHYELFFRAPEAMLLYDHRSKFEISYDGKLSLVKELEVYELVVDEKETNFLLIDNQKVIELINALEPNVNRIQGFFYNNIFYVTQLLITKETEDVE